METCREALERRQEGKAGMGAGHKDHGRTILGMPLGLYLGVLALTSVCMYTVSYTHLDVYKRQV